MRKPRFTLLVAFVFFGALAFQASTLQFTAQDILTSMAKQGVPLHNASNQWGLWAVRVMPIVTGGGYTITGGSTTQPGWGYWPAPFGTGPYASNPSAWFFDYSGAEVANTPANPLYMIMDQPANTFTSYTFDASGTAIGSVPPDPIVPPQVGGGGTNVVTQVQANSFFDVFFDLDPGATWSGGWHFVVDGSKYTLGTSQNPGGWVENYWGGYWGGGGLALNSGAGYQGVPEPGSLLLLGTGLLGAARFIRGSRRLP